MVSTAVRAPRNDPALFALALAAKLGDIETRRAAHAALPQVARIGTHLFHFAEYVKALGGWGRGTMRAFAGWYNDMEFSIADPNDAGMLDVVGFDTATPSIIADFATRTARASA